MRRRRTSLTPTRPYTPPGVTEGEMVFVTCGFCGGRGLYPFGHPPSSARCAICNGQGKVRVKDAVRHVRSLPGDGRCPRQGAELHLLSGKGSGNCPKYVSGRDGRSRHGGLG